MKQIKILLSSVLTLLLITGNNASYASPHIRDFGPSKFKANKPNINTFKGQVRKGNVNAFKGQVRKGNRFVPDGRNDGKVTLKRKALPNKGRFNALNIPFNSNVRSGGNNTCVENIVGGTMCSARKSGAKTQIKFRGQEGQSFSRGLHNNGAFRERESGFASGTGPFTLEHGPGIVSTGGAHAVNDNDSRISVLDIEGTGEGVIKSTGAFDIAPVGKDGFTASSEEQHISGKDGVLGGQESGWFHPVDGSITNTTTTPTIIDHWVVTPKPDGALGPDVVTTLEHGPGIVSTGGVHAVNDNDSRLWSATDVDFNDSRIGSTGGAHGVQQPKGVPLKFINGVWTEDLPYDLHNTFAPQPMPGDYTLKSPNPL